MDPVLVATAQETPAPAVVNTPAPDDFQAYKASRKPQPAPTPEEPKPAVAAPAPTEQVEDSEAEGEQPEAEQKPEGEPSDKQKKGGWQRKIERLEREKQELAQRLAQRDAETTKQEPTKQAEPATVAGKPVAPKIGDFNSYEDYQTAHDAYVEKLQDWKIEQFKAEQRRQSEQERAQSEQQKALTTWNERLNAAKQRISDFDEVLANATAEKDIQVSQAMHQVITQSEQGPELVYHLAKNPSEAERISKLDPISAAMELGKIAAKVAPGAAPAKPASVKASAAPPPVKPVGKNASTAQTLDDAGDDFQKFKEYRLKGRK